MAPRTKTRERIVQVSLELFNEQGERSVSTNHIAAHMEISPGNLYYHFPHKQAIIAQLFGEYEALVTSFMVLPVDRLPTIAGKRDYFLAVLDAMWRYRFLHRDLEHLLSADPQLAARYRLFCQNCLLRAKAIYQAFIDAGILQMNEAQIEWMSLNTWIVLTSWVRFLCTTREQSTQLDQDAIRRGVYQALMLESGFIAPQSREEFEALCEAFHAPIHKVLG
ncbi:TetR/AcrR family transcriptional regulator [Pseudomonas sp. CDFA 602]|uniref:TetR/AcrR family transcriptional regulator n=1 Tax=Pseudomonas californiensis TaxID=2829823 RepID=UPI001E5FFAF6|nr:TetR/AcrR family transcriptional regulator [Pseudomonas californiensis]MCD5992332.1 TetR/AcrR family transcriptional regulator [Pseudomonas californiensis]MCD5997940.1 TetR/AcrR family transcriptional regulator [Pseudomonas californiensis]